MGYAGSITFTTRSTQRAHTSTKTLGSFTLTSCAHTYKNPLNISNFLDPVGDPNHHQNEIIFVFVRTSTFPENCMKIHSYILSNLVHRQTDRQTERKTNQSHQKHNILGNNTINNKITVKQTLKWLFQILVKSRTASAPNIHPAIIYFRSRPSFLQPKQQHKLLLSSLIELSDWHV